MNPHDEYSIDEDVTRLKKVWNDIKEPKVKMPKGAADSTQNATQTRISRNEVSHNKHTKGTRVVVSESNLKNTVRNPKADPEKVIEIQTKPEKPREGTVAREGMASAPEHLILTVPGGTGLKEGEDLKRQLAEREHEISLLRVSNSRNEDRVRRLEGIIEQKDATIEELRARERELTQRVAQLDSEGFNFTYGKVEYENYRHDSRRLLKLLKNTEEYGQFAELALDDGGVRYLSGLEGVKTRLDAPSGKRQFHFCTCNKDFIAEPLVWVP